jgi:hypothetical protein
VLLCCRLILSHGTISLKAQTTLFSLRTGMTLLPVS